MDIPRQSNADSLNEKRKADNPVANSDEDSDEDLDVPRPNTNKQVYFDSNIYDFVEKFRI